MEQRSKSITAEIEQAPAAGVVTPHWSDELGRRAPNVLTLCRFLAVPVFVILLTSPTPARGLWATVVFLAASLTDWLDGYIARIYKAESIVGTVLDPLADKVLVMAALVMLAAAPIEPQVPAWMVVLLLGRDMIVTGLRSLAALKGTVVPASPSAKHKTAWTFIAIVALLIHETYPVFGVVVNFHLAGIVFLWIALVLSVGSGIAYAVELRNLFDG